MLTIIALTAPSLAATLTVDPSTTGAYNTITAAIAAATTGDEIEVAAGTYTECVNTNGKSLTISGMSGSAATTIDASGTCGNAVTAEGGETLTLSGFTIENLSLIHI